VYEEVVIQGLKSEHPDASIVELAVTRQELTVVHMDDADLSETVRALSLGKGEKQSIQLGLKESSEWVLLDDLLAREEARRLGLKVKGTVGIITEAYRQGHMTIDEVEVTFRIIMDREDIWISDALVRRVWDELRKA